MKNFVFLLFLALSLNSANSFAYNDFTIPVISTLSPANSATDVSINSNLVVTFDQNITLGTGNITITEAGGAIFQTIDVTTNFVAISGEIVTIYIPKELDKGKSYSIQIEATAFEDGSGNFFAGILDTTTWVFSTEVNSAPTFTSTAALKLITNSPNYLYEIATIDLDKDFITVSATTLPSWLTLNKNTEIQSISNPTSGFENGNLAIAKFIRISGIVADKKNNLFVVDNSRHIRKITSSEEVSSFASNVATGDVDSQIEIAIDSKGNLYVTDAGGHRIQKITPTGVLSTFAGSGVRGHADLNGINAQFSDPKGIAIDANDNIYLTEGGLGHRVRKITPSGDVTTLAGSITGQIGFNNANGTSALFSNPSGIAVDANGNVFVADTTNDRIRKITPTGDVTTFAGKGVDGTANGIGENAEFTSVTALKIDVLGNLYAADINKIRKITPNAVVSDYLDTNSFTIKDFTFDVNGNLFLTSNTNTNRHIIFKNETSYSLSGNATGLTEDQEVVLKVTDNYGGETNQSFTIDIVKPTITGLSPVDDVTNVSVSTTNLEITFSENIQKNNIDFFIYDTLDDSVFETVKSSQITITNNVASITLSKKLRKDKGYYIQIPANLFKNTADNNFIGIADKTTWNFTTEANIPPSFTSAPVTTVLKNELYFYEIEVTDIQNDPLTLTASALPTWLRLKTAGIKTFAGNGTISSVDNVVGTNASFSDPQFIVEDTFGNLFVTDINSISIRKITPNGVVSTFVSNVGFVAIKGMAIDHLNNIYVSDQENSNRFIVKKIVPDGTVTNFAGSTKGEANGAGAAAQFNGFGQMACDNLGNIFLVDNNSKAIRKITPSAVVSLFAGTTALSGLEAKTTSKSSTDDFNTLGSIAIDSSNNLFVTDFVRIRKITPSGIVSTFAGSDSFLGIGSNNGFGSAARFDNLTNIAIDAADNIYIKESGKLKIRKITLDTEVTTFLEFIEGFADTNLSNLQLNQFTTDFLINKEGDFVFVDRENRRIRKIALKNAINGTPTSTDLGPNTVTLNIADDYSANENQTFTINVASSNIFTGATSGMWSSTSTWPANTLPLATDNVIIENGSSITVDVTNAISNKITVNTGGTLIINDEKAVLTQDDFINNGSVTIESSRANSGVLFVKGKSTGTITYKRGGLEANKWHIVTAPVSGQQIEPFVLNNGIRINSTPDPDRYAIAKYNDANAATFKWEYYDANLTTEEFNLGQSYSMSKDSNGSLSFTGTLTTTDVGKTITAGEWNAIGNPFTTFIPANKNSDNNFINDNLIKFDTNNIGLYVWDNTQNKYKALSLVDIAQTSLPPGQGFFVKAKLDATSFDFNQDKRLVQPVSGNNTFNRSEDNKPVIKLMVSNNTITVDTKIMYFDTATKGLDPGFDVGNFSGASFDVYTHLLDKSSAEDFTIQSLPTNDYEEMIVPVGVKAVANSEIKFSAEVSNLPKGIQLYIEDKEIGSFFRLDDVNSNYAVTLSSGINSVGRFYLHTTSQALSVENSSEEFANIQIYLSDNNTLTLKGLSEGENEIKLYDLLGKEIIKTIFYDEINKDILLPKIATGIYLVKLKTVFGRMEKKIVIK